MTCPRRTDGMQEQDVWREAGGIRRCSHCDSLHPDDAQMLIDRGARVVTVADGIVAVGLFGRFDLAHEVGG